MGCAEPAAILLLRGCAAASERFEALIRRHVPDVGVTSDPAHALERCLGEAPPVLAVDWSEPASAAAFCGRVRAQPGGDAVFVLAITERDADIDGILAAVLRGGGARATLRARGRRRRGPPGAARRRPRARHRDAVPRQALAQTQARLVGAGRMASVGHWPPASPTRSTTPSPSSSRTSTRPSGTSGSLDRRRLALRAAAPWARSHGDGRGPVERAIRRAEPA